MAREISNFPLSSFSQGGEGGSVCIKRDEIFLGGVCFFFSKQPQVLLSSSSSSRVSLEREREAKKIEKYSISIKRSMMCVRSRLFITRDDETTRETRCATTEVDEDERKRNNVDSCFLLLLARARVSLTRTRKFCN